MPRWAARTDKTQSTIVERLRSLDVIVRVTSNVGQGFPDLVCLDPWTRVIFLVEVKDGAKTPSQRKLTPDEQRFFNEWLGCVQIVSSLEEADTLVNQVRERGHAPHTP